MRTAKTRHSIFSTRMESPKKRPVNQCTLLATCAASSSLMRLAAISRRARFSHPNRHPLPRVGLPPVAGDAAANRPELPAGTFRVLGKAGRYGTAPLPSLGRIGGFSAVSAVRGTPAHRMPRFATETARPCVLGDERPKRVRGGVAGWQRVPTGGATPGRGRARHVS
jgi:hypothetical protein